MSQPFEPVKIDLIPGEWVELTGTWKGPARVMAANDSDAAQCWVTESGMVDADGPVTVDYYEA